MSMNPARLALMAILILASLPLAAPAATILQTLGIERYANGAIVPSGTFITDNGGEPAPFNAISGGDATANMNVSFTFSYGAIADPITAASILISLYEGESSAPGSQLALFRLNGSILLTALLDAQMEATPGVSSQINFYTVTLPSTAFASLAGGTATFDLQLQGPGLGVLGPTDFNGGGLDFARLTLRTDPITPEVPEPATAFLAGGALLAGAAFLRRRRA